MGRREVSKEIWRSVGSATDGGREKDVKGTDQEDTYPSKTGWFKQFERCNGDFGHLSARVGIFGTLANAYSTH